MLPMRGSFHGPGGRFGVGFLVLDLVSILSKLNRKNRRRRRNKVVIEMGSSISDKREAIDSCLVLISLWRPNS